MLHFPRADLPKRLRKASRERARCKTALAEQVALRETPTNCLIAHFIALMDELRKFQTAVGDVHACLCCTVCVVCKQGAKRAITLNKSQFFSWEQYHSQDVFHADRQWFNCRGNKNKQSEEWGHASPHKSSRCHFWAGSVQRKYMMCLTGH